MGDPLADPGSTSRTRIHRLPEKAVHDRDVAYAILDAGLVGHVAVNIDGQPHVTPMGYGRHGDDIVLHGSRASRLMKALASGAPLCLNVTLLDGMVMARSLFESSMHYRSATVYGSAHEVSDDALMPALEALSEHLMPGRWNQARQPSPKELRATLTLAVPLDEIAVKVSAEEPVDTPEDHEDPRIAALWAGVIPIERAWGVPRADDRTPPGSPAPAIIASWNPPSSP